MIFVTLALGMAFAAAAPHIEVFQPATVDILPDRVFTPLGFDDNDNAQVVLDGSLSDTCYKLGPTQFRVEHASHKIFVRQQAFYYPGGWCADVRIPYVQTVNLGILQPGRYEVLLEQNGKTTKPVATLPVAVARTKSPDDFLYAPITETHFDSARVNLVLGGFFTNSCMVFNHVKTHVLDNQVIEILPIVDLERALNCAQVANEFSVSVSLKNIPHGRYLLHIRSLNGQAINRVVEL